MKKLFTLIFVSLFLISLTSFASALELNPFANKLDVEKDLGNIDNNFLKQDFNSNYGVIKLSKTFLWIETDRIAEYSLIENTEHCLINCEAKGKATLYQNAILFEDIGFKDIKERLKNVEYEFWIEKERVIIREKLDLENPIEKCEIVSSNESQDFLSGEKSLGEEVCFLEYPIINITKTEKYWEKYNKEKLKLGDYIWKITGKKKIGENVDWVVESHGKSFDEWAWWNSTWRKCRTLNIKTNATYTNATDVVVARLNFTGMQSDGGDVRIVNAPCGDSGEEVDFDILNAIEGEVNVSIKVSEMSGSEFNYSVYYETVGTTTTTGNNNVPDRPFTYNWGFELGNENYWTFTDASGGGWDVQTSCTNGLLIGTYCAESWSGSDARQGRIESNSFYVNSKMGRSQYFDGDSEGQAGGLDLDCDGNVDVSISEESAGQWANTSTNSHVGRLACWRFQDYGTGGSDWSNVDHLRIFDGDVSVTENPLWLNTLGAEEDSITLTATQSSPANNTNFSSTDTFDVKCNFTSLGQNIFSVKLNIYDSDDNIDYTDTESGLTTLNYNKTWSGINLVSGGNYQWECFGYGSEGVNGSSINWSLGIEDVRVATATLSSPDDNINSSDNTIDLSANFTGNTYNNISSVKINVYDSSDNLDYTNIESGLELINYNKTWTTTTLTDDTYKWEAFMYGDGGLNASDGNRTFTIDTTPLIEFETPTPTNNTNLSRDNFQVNVSLTETYFQNITFNLFNSSIDNINSTTFTDSTRIFNFTNLDDGTYYFNVTTETSTGQKNTTETRNVLLDATPPTINSIYPNTTFDYHILGNNLTYNYSVTDTHFDKAVFNYNGVNQTFTGTTNSSSFQPIHELNNGTWYFNDTFGNMNEYVMRWNYRIFQNNITYNSEAIELSQETFILNFTYTPSLWTSISGNLNYDDTNYSSTLSGSGGTKLLTNTLSIPSINSEQNKTFYWVIRLTNSSGEFFINTDEYNQTITDIGIDNCSSYSTRLYNLTLEDEEEQTSIRGDIEIELEITGIETITDTINFSTSFTNVSNSGVCLNTNLTNQGLYLDTTIKYKSNGFQTEYYNIQNYVLNTSSKTQEITLYDLNSTSATIFDITYKGSDFIAVSDAIIIITKKFVSEGLFKTVEIPLTDIDGKTTASLEKDSEIYTFNIYKDGEFLSTFQNVIPTCQNDLTDDCEINLNEVSSPDSIDDFTNLDNLNYQVTWDEDTSTIDLTYSTATGESSEINLLVTQFDQYENDTICDNSVTASSGSLSCVVPSSYTNQTVIIQLYTDEEFVSRYSISLQQSPVDYFGYTGLFLALLIIITIPFMFITSLIGVIIGIIIGMVMLSLLLLSSGANIYSITGGIVWFFIAAAILIWKLNENDRR